MPKVLFAALTSLLCVAGCGKAGNIVTVNGHDLVVKEQDYGVINPGYFCDSLANGQYEVVLSDKTLCGDLHTDAGNPSFHGAVETSNIRMVFPSFLKVTGNSFQVGKSDCSTNAPGTEALFVFQHSPAGATKYDYTVQADSGTINISSTATSVMKDSEIDGTYDVMIAGAHLTGTIKALYCAPLVPGIGS